jgi:hypothetical protein
MGDLVFVDMPEFTEFADLSNFGVGDQAAVDAGFQGKFRAPLRSRQDSGDPILI